MSDEPNNATKTDHAGMDEPPQASEQDQHQAGSFIDLPSRWDRWEPLAEVIATLILALATLAAAWSGYQSARWGGEQSTNFSQAGALRTELTRCLNHSRAINPNRYRLIHQLGQRLCSRQPATG